MENSECEKMIKKGWRAQIVRGESERNSEARVGGRSGGEESSKCEEDQEGMNSLECERRIRRGGELRV